MGANNKLNKGICTNVQEEEVPTLGMEKEEDNNKVCVYRFRLKFITKSWP